MREYKHQGETFQLDDSKGCYVTVTYKHLTGYVGVNLGKKASPQNPYAWYTAREIGGADCVTPDGLKFGIVDPKGASFQANLNALCVQLLLDFRTEEAAKAAPAKYCAELHDAVKNLP